MKYLCLVYPGADFAPQRADVPGYVSVRDAMAKAGVYVDSGALSSPPGPRPPFTVAAVRSCSPMGLSPRWSST